MRSLCFHVIPAALAVLLSLLPGSAFAADAAKPEEDPWPSLKQQIFGDRAIASEDGTVTLQAPEQADDAAVVPITVRIPPEVTAGLKTMTLIIDKNPQPVVAVFHFGPAAGAGGERNMATRVRIDSFSHVRAIVETEDGSLHMATKFVAAAGGCGAMQAKDPDSETADLGKMIVKTFEPALGTNPIFEGQVMLKHPNENGMQLDINTGKFIPARYLKEMIVKRDGAVVFTMDGSFSLSTNPNFRFSFGRGGDNVLDVAITDTSGAVFTGRSEPRGS